MRIADRDAGPGRRGAGGSQPAGGRRGGELHARHVHQQREPRHGVCRLEPVEQSARAGRLHRRRRREHQFHQRLCLALHGRRRGRLVQRQALLQHAAPDRRCLHLQFRISLGRRQPRHGPRLGRRRLHQPVRHQRRQHLQGPRFDGVHGIRPRRRRERAHHPVRRRHPGGPGPHHERDDQPVLHHERPQLQDRLRPRRVLRRLYRGHAGGQSELRAVPQQPPDHGRAARQPGLHVRDVGSRRHGRLSLHAGAQRHHRHEHRARQQQHQRRDRAARRELRRGFQHGDVQRHRGEPGRRQRDPLRHQPGDRRAGGVLHRPGGSQPVHQRRCGPDHGRAQDLHGGPFGLGRDEPRAFQLRHRRGDGAGRAELPGECLHQHVLGHVPCLRLDDAGGQQPGHGRGRRVFRDLPGAQADADRPAPELGGQR